MIYLYVGNILCIITPCYITESKFRVFEVVTLPHFRDPVHGFIEVSEMERRIVDSYPFRRLRNIRQLATTYLVYHGAEHTRFGHSIGVMHLVSRTFDAITQKNPCLFRKNAQENQTVVQWYRQILRLIALTHDLGHAPFSHASEELFPDGRTHEEYTRDIINHSEIAEHIHAIGADFQARHGAQYAITPDLLWSIYGEEDVLADNYIMPDFKFLKSLMDGEMDCDKMDYLLRDSKFCGVSYGKYDLDRFISTLTVYKNPEGTVMQLAISSGGLQAFEEFVLARYFMFIQVYYHKTRRYFDYLLVKCLKEILPDGKYPLNVDAYLAWDDVEVLHAMKNKASALTKQYFARTTMTCVRETPAHAQPADNKNLEIIYRALVNEVGEDNVMLNKVDKTAHKLLPAFLPTNDDSGKDIKIIDKYTGAAKNIMEDSLILAGIVDPIKIRRLYVNKDHAVRAKKLIRGLCGE